MRKKKKNPITVLLHGGIKTFPLQSPASFSSAQADTQTAKDPFSFPSLFFFHTEQIKRTPKKISFRSISYFRRQFYTQQLQIHFTDTGNGRCIFPARRLRFCGRYREHFQLPFWSSNNFLNKLALCTNKEKNIENGPKNNRKAAAEIYTDVKHVSSRKILPGQTWFSVFFQQPPARQLRVQ